MDIQESDYEVNERMERLGLAFLLKDAKYVEQVFYEHRLPLEFFRDIDNEGSRCHSNNRRLAEIIKDYYDKHGTRITEEDLWHIMGQMYQAKELSDPLYAN